MPFRLIEAEDYVRINPSEFGMLRRYRDELARLWS
jgi:DNA-directed RNA polymerase subunit E'/Rpb7